MNEKTGFYTVKVNNGTILYFYIANTDHGYYTAIKYGENDSVDDFSYGDLHSEYQKSKKKAPANGKGWEGIPQFIIKSLFMY